MTTPSPSSSGLPPSAGSRAAGAVRRTARLTRKELREILRDRRTIATLVLMPLLLYPILSITLGRFLVSSFEAGGETRYAVGFHSPEEAAILEEYLRLGDRLLRRAGGGGEAGGSPGVSQRANLAGRPETGTREQLLLDAYVQPDLEACVAQGRLHLGVRLRSPSRRSDRSESGGPLVCELIYCEGSSDSAEALHYVERRLMFLDQRVLQRRLQRLGAAGDPPAEIIRRGVSGASGAVISLATLVPLILVLTTITGAVYPAIDLTAGERERGTLEILMAAPTPRWALLLAKYVAVLIVSLLTATVNVIAMTATILATGLGPLLFGAAGLSWTVIGLVFALMALFAAFFSALLLTLTSFARSFKEAQVYLIPLMVISLTPALLSLMPGLKLTGALAVAPLLNIVLLSRDLFEGTATASAAVAAVVSTLFYALAAIAAATRVFGGDAILLGSPGGWSDLFRRPRGRSGAPSVASAMLCLALIFPAYFLLANLLAHSAGESLGRRLAAASLIAAGVLGGFPLAAACFGRVRLRDCFALKRASLRAVLASVVLGLCLWPLAHELFLLNEKLGLTLMTGEQFEAAQRLLDSFSRIRLAPLLLSLAAAPAVFEESFFRGFLFGAVRRRHSAREAILWTSLLFALFHVAAPTVLAVERFLPSMFLGLVLGWVRSRSGSLAPAILLHACHNGLLLTMVHYREELAAFGWGVQERTHLPAAWLAGACLLSAAAAALLLGPRRRP